jgi:hypothetical protein
MLRFTIVLTYFMANEPDAVIPPKDVTRHVRNRAGIQNLRVPGTTLTAGPDAACAGMAHRNRLLMPV